MSSNPSSKAHLIEIFARNRGILFCPHCAAAISVSLIGTKLSRLGVEIDRSGLNFISPLGTFCSEVIFVAIRVSSTYIGIDHSIAFNSSLSYLTLVK